MTRKELIQSVIDRRLTYLSPARLESLLGAAETVEESKVPGDFAEFGIALGGSGICLARSLDEGRRYIGFDLFGTIPAPTDQDGARPHERYKTIASGESTGIGGDAYYGYIPDLYEVVRGNFASFECPVDGRRIRLVKGLFEETLPKNGDMKIALAHIDCDWFDPVTLCLDYVWPRLSGGGIVILDDYSDWDGCKKATDQFLSRSAGFEVVTLEPHAVVKKKPAEQQRQGGFFRGLRSILPR